MKKEGLFVRCGQKIWEDEVGVTKTLRLEFFGILNEQFSFLQKNGD